MHITVNILVMLIASVSFYNHQYIIRIIYSLLQTMGHCTWKDLWTVMKVTKNTRTVHGMGQSMQCITDSFILPGMECLNLKYLNIRSLCGPETLIKSVLLRVVKLDIFFVQYYLYNIICTILYNIPNGEDTIHLNFIYIVQNCFYAMKWILNFQRLY